MSRRRKPPEPIEATERCARIALIMGAQSAAAQALRRYQELRAAGHETAILLYGSTWLVQEPAPNNDAPHDE